MTKSTQLAIRFTEYEVELIDAYQARHRLDSRSAAVRHAMQAACHLEEGESVALKPARAKGVSKRAGASQSDAQKVVDRILGARARRDAEREKPRSDYEGDEEYYRAVAKRNKLLAQGVGPEPWPD